VVLLPIKGGEIPSAIIDQTEFVEEAFIEKETTVEDIPAVSDFADIKNEPGTDFYFDENGTKHYILNVRDAPDFEG